MVLLGNLSPSSDCHICFVLSFIEVNLLRWIYLVTRYHIPWKTNWRYLVYILPSTYLHTRKAINCSPQQRTTLWRMSRGDEINVSHKNAWQHQIGYPIYETAARGLWRKWKKNVGILQRTVTFAWWAFYFDKIFEWCVDAGEIFKMIFLLPLIIYMVCHFAIEFRNNKYQKIR